jgi:hypothetical protein
MTTWFPHSHAVRWMPMWDGIAPCATATSDYFGRLHLPTPLYTVIARARRVGPYGPWPVAHQPATLLAHVTTQSQYKRMFYLLVFYVGSNMLPGQCWSCRRATAVVSP